MPIKAAANTGPNEEAVTENSRMRSGATRLITWMSMPSNTSTSEVHAMTTTDSPDRGAASRA